MYCFLWSGNPPLPPVCVSIFGRHMQRPVLRWQNIKTTLWDTFWDIVGHCEIFWNILRHYKTLRCNVRYCLTFRDIVKHHVSAYLWDICRAKASGGRISKTHCVIFWDILRLCESLWDISEHCETLCVSKFVRHLQGPVLRRENI